MSLEHDDPRVTAWVLGEFDEELALDAAARADAAAIRAVADALREELANATTLGLTAAQRNEIERAAAAPSPWTLLPYALSSSLAAAVMVVVLFGTTLASSDRQRELDGPTETRVEDPRYWKDDGLVDAPYKAVDDDVARRIDEGDGSLGRLARVDGKRDTSLSGISNLFSDLDEAPRSTFSIDVDTASYSNVRRHLRAGQLPPADEVRIEELINYFDYELTPPDDAPFAIHLEVADCPWHEGHRLARIGLEGREVAPEARPPANLVFLVDVSGSMQSPDKLPLLKRSLRLLVEQLDADDRIAIVVYAGASGLVLPPTPGTSKPLIRRALADLEAGGSTNGSAGLELAYAVAQESFVEGGVNRVLLATDGDFNVGVTDREALTTLIQAKAKTGVELSVLGFGASYDDARMEELSNRGNGNFAYIDSAAQAHRVLVDQLGGTLVTIAKDVKVQVIFNPQRVADYRLVGYDNRRLAAAEFDDDAVDAGEIGAGHTVTALYDFVPKNGPDDDYAMKVRLRYKPPGGDESSLIERDIVDIDGGDGSTDLRWAAAVAGFGMLLRDDPERGTATWDTVLDLARSAQGVDENGDRAELIELVTRARALDRGEPASPPPPPPLADATRPAPHSDPAWVFAWLILAAGFGLIVGPLAWIKGAHVRARYRNLGLREASAPTVVTLIGLATTVLALAMAALVGVVG